MNSFSTDGNVRRRARGTAFAVAILFLATAGFVALCIYSAHKDKVAGKFARRVPKAGGAIDDCWRRNAGRVSDSLYRGAQRRGQGYEELKRPGITIVVALRNSKPVARETSETREQMKVEATGTRYVEIPTSAFPGPTDFQVATFLHLLRGHPNDKIFVHCYFGDDRTGVMIATYRIADEHWTSDQAYNEMRAFHVHKHLLLMGHHVKIFPADYALNPAFRSLRDDRANGPNSGS
jgi:protein-tyrosine phosphatase